MPFGLLQRLQAGARACVAWLKAIASFTGARLNDKSVAPKMMIGCVSGLAILLMAPMATATENGASVYPVGVETVLPGMTPPPRATMFYEFSTFYSATAFMDERGHNSIPGFRLNVFGNAVKIVHNWNLPVFGGTLNTVAAVPVLYERLTVRGKHYSNMGIGNIALAVAQIGYHRRNWHWSYEPNLFFPGTSYSKLDPLNIGQHNFALGPGAAFSYLPWAGKTEISSKLLYIFNFANPDNHYRSGQEFSEEYAVMQQVHQRVALGVNGYLYLQTTDDTQNGTTVANGFRGRNFAIGPEIRVKLGRQSGLAFKYQRDLSVRNRTMGNALWFHLCFPLPLRMPK